nr:hypothetical protein [Tanacetum cinerariifolium]
MKTCQQKQNTLAAGMTIPNTCKRISHVIGQHTVCSTYTSISSDSDGPSWGIPLKNVDGLSEMDPYERSEMDNTPSAGTTTVEDQPNDGNVSPIIESPGHIADSKSMEEDSTDYPDEPEDDDVDPEEDHTNYPANGEDGDDEPFDDDDDDNTDDEDEKPTEDEDDDEEKHLAPADSSVTRLCRARKTVRLEPPMSASMEACIAEHAATPIPPTSPAYDQAPLVLVMMPGLLLELLIEKRIDIRFKIDVVRGQRTTYETELHEVMWQRVLLLLLDHLEKVNLRISYQALVRRQESEDFYTQLHDAWTNRRDIRFKIDVVRGQRTTYETELHERQSTKDLAVRQMMRIHVIEARSQIDTMEDTDSSCIVSLPQWLEKMESVFHISSCAIDNQVKSATYPLLEKSDAAEGFKQIIDFLSESYIYYALTVSPHIYILCIKQFWNFASVKRSGDVTRLQALVGKKKIVISEAVIREILQLNDAEGVVCLPNEEILAGLAQIGYEKLSTKLTFYKAFFSSQWKFMIHTILQSLSAKRTSWNEFSTTIASVVICLSKGQRFNFSKYIFDSLVRNVDSSSKFYMVGKGFSGVETPLFEGMIADRQPAEEELGAEQVQVDAAVAATVVEDVVEDVAEDVAHVATPSPLPHGIPSPPQEPSSPPQQPHRLEIVKLKARVKKLEKTDNGRMMNEDEGIKLVKDAEIAESEGRQADKQVKIYNIDLDHSSKVLSMQEDDSKVHEVVEVVTTANDASATIPVVSATIHAAALIVVAAYTRKRKGVIIRDPEEELSLKTSVETPKVKDKGKGIMVEAPKPMKKKDQIELDAEYARKLHEEINKDDADFNKDVDWDTAMEHVNQKSYTNPHINETPAQKAAKRRKLNEEAQEAKALKKQLEIVHDEDDDVFTKATPLGRKVLVVDYEIVMINNKPRYKIIRADDTHQLYISFITLLKNFDREDLEDL